MSFLNDYPQLKIIKDISKRNKVEIYLVGGFLRDHVLGVFGKDFDFAVEKNALKIAKEFSTRIKGAYVLLDRDNGCARVVKKKNKQIYTFDFADFRAKTFKGDIAHRDFTINTLSLNLKSLKESSDLKDILIDIKGGVRDINKKVIKLVYAKAFKEDPLRMMRAFSLNAALGFKIIDSTLKQIKKDKDLIRDVSYERITEELFKILKTPKSVSVLKHMHKQGLLELIIPQIRVMFNCKQGGYHHLNVWKHSLETVAQVEKIIKGLKCQETLDYLNEHLSGNRTRKETLKLAALLHDIGKPDTKKKEGNHFSFHGHEHKGRKIVKYIADMLKISIAERHALEDMVMWHLRPGYLSNFKKPTERAIYRYFRDTKDEAVSTAFLSLADQRSTRGPLTTEEDQKHHEEICLNLIGRYFAKVKEEPFVRLIDGNDLIKKLKIKPSPLFSKILLEIEEKQSLGKIKTKKEAIDLARKFVK
ncbi:MAG: HD domain-containing protein [Candidatus Zapsychrus exili]|nr:HD domain-containing protein [Candidatus Zapsychrus exili]